MFSKYLLKHGCSINYPGGLVIFAISIKDTFKIVISQKFGSQHYIRVFLQYATEVIIKSCHDKNDADFFKLYQIISRNDLAKILFQFFLNIQNVYLCE